MTLDLQAVYKRSDAYVHRQVAGQSVLVPVRNTPVDLDNLYVLNEVGCTIWELLDGEKTVAQIVGAVCQAYDVADGRAGADLAEFISQLQELGAVEAA